MAVPSIVASLTMPGGEHQLAARPFVLGPSLGTTTAIWNGLRPHLSASHPLICWDLPGHGASPATSEPFSMEELAKGLANAIDETGVDEFAYAGISLGGVAGLRLALDQPERVTYLAMICSLPKIGTAEGWLQRAADVRAMGTSSLMATSAGRWFRPEFLEREPDVSSQILNGLLEIDDESYALCVDALRATDLRNRVAELEMPFSLIAGDSDPVIPLDSARETVIAAPHGTLHVVAEASHLAAVEHPAAVAEILLSESGRA